MCCRRGVGSVPTAFARSVSELMDLSWWFVQVDGRGLVSHDKHGVGLDGADGVDHLRGCISEGTGECVEVRVGVSTYRWGCGACACAYGHVQHHSLYCLI
jgi:hypothetical protein